MQKRIIPLYLEKTNLKPRNTFSNKCNLFGPAHNKYDKLTVSMQVFLMSALTGIKTCLNLNSILTNNMENDYLL